MPCRLYDFFGNPKNLSATDLFASNYANMLFVALAFPTFYLVCVFSYLISCAPEFLKNSVFDFYLVKILLYEGFL